MDTLLEKVSPFWVVATLAMAGILVVMTLAIMAGHYQ